MWGAIPGADREHTAIRVAEAMQKLAEGEALLTAGDADAAGQVLDRGEALLNGDSGGGGGGGGGRAWH